MRSVVLDIEHRRLEERDLPPPPIQSPTQVLFRVHEVGVCGTDREMVNFRLWRPEKDVPYLVIGHEALGQVVEAGTQSGFARGDWVVPMVRRPCQPVCAACGSGRADLCQTGLYTERGIFGADGYFTEYAVDDAAYLARVPERLIDFAVLIEPLSVVEKAVRRALDVRQTGGREALVLGLGPIGILAALLLDHLGFKARVFSLEPADHPRAQMLAACGIPYSSRLEGKADLIVEAAGNADAAIEATRCLKQAGVFVTLGATTATAPFSFIHWIVTNATLIGSVNATPASFAAALTDLEALPSGVLTKMIRRFGFGDYRSTLFDRPPGPEPKFVHRIDSGHGSTI